MKGVKCPHCGGVTTSPKRKISLERAVANHLASCHARPTTNKESK